MSDNRPEDIRRKEAAFRAAQSNYDFQKAWDLGQPLVRRLRHQKTFPRIRCFRLRTPHSGFRTSCRPRCHAAPSVVWCRRANG